MEHKVKCKFPAIELEILVEETNKNISQLQSCNYFHCSGQSAIINHFQP